MPLISGHSGELPRAAGAELRSRLPLAAYRHGERAPAARMHSAVRPSMSTHHRRQEIAFSLKM